MAEVEKKAKETQLKEDAIGLEAKRVAEELLNREQMMSMTSDAEVKEIRRMKDELHKREQWVVQQMEELKKRQDKAPERERQIDLEVKKKEFGR